MLLLSVGASGAINGVVGMYLVLYPLNDVSVFYFLGFRAGTFRVSSFWMILLWFIFDIWGILAGNTGVAFVAHIGGFIGGFALMIHLLRTRRIVMEEREKSLLDAMGWMPKIPSEPPDGRPLEHLSDDALRIPSLKSGRCGSISAPAPPRDGPRWQDPAAQRPHSQIPGASPADGFITVLCPCGKKMRALRRLAGKKARCPACSGVIEIPPA